VDAEQLARLDGLIVAKGKQVMRATGELRALLRQREALIARPDTPHEEDTANGKASRYPAHASAVHSR
jgi:hypothetical protein